MKLQFSFVSPESVLVLVEVLYCNSWAEGPYVFLNTVKCNKHVFLNATQKTKTMYAVYWSH